MEECSYKREGEEVDIARGRETINDALMSLGIHGSPDSIIKIEQYNMVRIELTGPEFNGDDFRVHLEVAYAMIEPNPIPIAVGGYAIASEWHEEGCDDCQSTHFVPHGEPVIRSLSSGTVGMLLMRLINPNVTSTTGEEPER